ncbi:Fanconi anemia group D2 protein [Allomyces arbusculus]|nr:Fanconi anemia group D2 protein [Allomyces arbusculus]
MPPARSTNVFVPLIERNGGHFPDGLDDLDDAAAVNSAAAQGRVLAVRLDVDMHEFKARLHQATTVFPAQAADLLKDDMQSWVDGSPVRALVLLSPVVSAGANAVGTAAGAAAGMRAVLADSLVKIMLDIDALQTTIVSFVADLILELSGEEAATQLGVPALAISQLRWLECVTDATHLATTLLNLLSDLAAADEQLRDALIAALPEIVPATHHHLLLDRLVALLRESRSALAPVTDAFSNLVIPADRRGILIQEVSHSLPSAQPDHLPLLVRYLLDEAGAAAMQPPGTAPWQMSEADRELPKQVVADLHRYLTFAGVDGSYVHLVLDELAVAFRRYKPIQAAFAKRIVDLAGSRSRDYDNAQSEAGDSNDGHDDVHGTGELSELDCIVLIVQCAISPAVRRDMEKRFRTLVLRGHVTATTFDKLITAYAPALQAYHEVLISLAEMLLKPPAAAGRGRPSIKAATAAQGAMIPAPLVRTASQLFFSCFAHFDAVQQQDVVASLVTLLGSGGAGTRQVDVALEILMTLARHEPARMAAFSVFLRSPLDSLDNFSVPQLEAYFRMLAAVAFGHHDQGLAACLASPIVDDMTILANKHMMRISRMSPLRLAITGILGCLALIEHYASRPPELALPGQQVVGHGWSNEADEMEGITKAIADLERCVSCCEDRAAAQAFLVDRLAAACEAGRIHPHVTQHMCAQILNLFTQSAERPNVAAQAGPSTSTAETWTLVRPDGALVPVDPAAERLPAEIQPLYFTSQLAPMLPPAMRLLLAAAMATDQDRTVIHEILPCFPVFSDQYRTCVVRYLRLTIAGYVRETHLEIETDPTDWNEKVQEVLAARVRALIQLVNVDKKPVAAVVADDEPAVGPGPAKRNKDDAADAAAAAEKTSVGDELAIELSADSVLPPFPAPLYRMLDIAPDTETFQYLLADLHAWIQTAGIAVPHERPGLTQVPNATATSATADAGVPLELVVNVAGTLCRRIVDMTKALDEEMDVMDALGVSDAVNRGRTKAHADADTAVLAAILNTLCAMVASPQIAASSNAAHKLIVAMATVIAELQANPALTQAAGQSLAHSHFEELSVKVVAFLGQFVPLVDAPATAVLLHQVLTRIADLAAHADADDVAAPVPDAVAVALHHAACEFLGKRWSGIDKKHDPLEYFVAQELKYNTDALKRIKEYVDAMTMIAHATADMPEAEGPPEQEKEDVALSEDSTCLMLNRHTMPAFYKISLGHLATMIRTHPLLTNEEEPEQMVRDKKLLEFCGRIAKLFGDLVCITKQSDDKIYLRAALVEGTKCVQAFVARLYPQLAAAFARNIDPMVLIFRDVQNGTRQLQHICGHSKISREKTLMAQVPRARKVLEEFVQGAKVMLLQNRASSAWWAGNLRHRDVKGKLVASQEPVPESDEEESGSGSEYDEDEDEEAKGNKRKRPALTGVAARAKAAKKAKTAGKGKGKGKARRDEKDEDAEEDEDGDTPMPEADSIQMELQLEEFGDDEEMIDEDGDELEEDNDEDATPARRARPNTADGEALLATAMARPSARGGAKGSRGRATFGNPKSPAHIGSDDDEDDDEEEEDE